MPSTMTTCGQLPALQLQTTDGAMALISLYGAHVLSWRSADGRERLFLSRASALDGSRAIRGGIPLIFPQFGTQGSGQRHGYARTSVWQVVASGEIEGGSFAELQLLPNALAPELAQAWPVALRFRVELRSQQLLLQLQVDNLGTASLQFAAALHSYFALDDIDAMQLHGLAGLHYLDTTQTPPSRQRQDAASLACTGKLDRLYYDLPQALQLKTGPQTLELQQTGFSDAVVWNPWQEDAQALADLGDDEYRSFICVEAAKLDKVELAAGASWVGRHVLTVR